MNQAFFCLFKAVGIIGMGAALYSILDGLGVPVCSGGCSDASQSNFSSIFGIPIGLFAIPLWVAILTCKGILRALSAALLALGAWGFLFIMYFVLGTFCPLCILHNSCAIVVSLLLLLCFIRRADMPPMRAGSIFILGLLVVVFALWKLPVEKGSERLESAAVRTKIVFPVNPEEHGDTLVISLTCPYCYELLYEYLTYDAGDKRLSIVIKSGENTRELAASILAAIYADYRKNGYEDFYASFQKVFLAVFRHSKEIESGEYAPLMRELDSISPDSDAMLPVAQFVLESHAAFVSRINSSQTPILIKDGTVILDRARMSPDMVFGGKKTPPAYIVGSSAGSSGKQQ